MSRMTSKGFTIIEVMLFLAITGLLAVLLLVGFNATIDRQRYKEGANSLLTSIQQQYSDAVNIQNTRANGTSCAAGVAGTNRGQDNCLVLGRFITVNGGAIKANNIVGAPTSSTATAAGDIAILKSYQPRPDGVNAEYTSTLDWGVRAVGAAGATANKQLVIAILRSPESGAVYTFSRNNSSVAPSNFQNMIVNTALPASPNDVGRSAIVLCVDPNNMAFGEKLAIRIKQNAANATAVELMSNSLLQAQGVPQC